MVLTSRQDQRQAHHDHPRGPDVGGEVQCVGFERLALVLGGDAAESAGAPPVHGHGNQHYNESPDGGFDFNPAEKQSHGRFVDDPGASHQQQAGLYESGEIFDLAMAVLVVSVGGLIGDTNGEIRQ